MAYRALDQSKLMPLFARTAVDPVLPWIPAWLHPNVLTLVGHLACWSGFALAWLASPPSVTASHLPTSSLLVRVVIAGLFWLYVWCDNLDGAHARRTEQTSNLGEVLDHGLDAPNAFLLTAAVLLVVGAPFYTASRWLVLACAHSPLLLFEQHRTGVFRLPVFNQLEAMVVATTLMLFLPMLSNESREALLGLGFVSMAVLSAWSFAQTLRSVGLQARTVWPACLGAMLVGIVVVFLPRMTLTVAMTVSLVSVLAMWVSVLWLLLQRHDWTEKKQRRTVVSSVVGSEASSVP